MHGYVKLKNVLSAGTLAHYGRETSRLVQELNVQQLPLEQRGTYAKAFFQVMNLWTHSNVVREFAFSRRLARIATELMGVSGVRMYHDQALYKESGGITPWHADQYYWPVDSDKTVTAWVPLSAVPMEMGPLQCSLGTHGMKFGRDLEIGDESETKLGDVLRDNPLDDGPFDLGEVSFHSGWLFHRAGANTSQTARGDDGHLHGRGRAPARTPYQVAPERLGGMVPQCTGRRDHRYTDQPGIVQHAVSPPRTVQSVPGYLPVNSAANGPASYTFSIASMIARESTDTARACLSE